MNISRRTFLGGLAAGYPALQGLLKAQVPSDVKHYVRFRIHGRVAYGLLKDKTVHELKGSIFDRPTKTEKTYALAAVKLLAPCEPTKVLAVALNYASHLGDRPKPKNPEIFFKAPSAVIEPGSSIVIPPGTNRCDYEGELVVVIGKKAKNISVKEAPYYSLHSQYIPQIYFSAELYIRVIIGSGRSINKRCGWAIKRLLFVLFITLMPSR